MRFFFLVISLLFSCNILISQSLRLTTSKSYVRAGDLDVQGDKITVEALIYLDQTANLTCNIVSKHHDVTNVNYLLRPLTFELTTYHSGNSGSTKFLQMYNPYKLETGRWYHIAGTYDGAIVKYYVDGCLVISQPWTGNLVQNDLITAIGNINSPGYYEQLFGMIDEVRIWNVCRTVDEIKNNMTVLNSPTTQNGLLAYYKFSNNYLNNQGNSLWNGTTVGSPSFSNIEATLAPLPTISATSSEASCLNVKDGSISISGNRNDLLYSINGVDFQSSSVFSTVSPGNYTVYVKSYEGCIVTQPITVGDKFIKFEKNITTSICEGENFYGYKTSGIYTDILKASVGCDTLQTLNLTVLPTKKTIIDYTICEGEIYLGYTISGRYTDKFIGSNGCDSIRILNLTVNPKKFVIINHSICDGESYLGYNSSGTYTDKFLTNFGCDSIRTLNLIVNPRFTTTVNKSICQGQSYEGHNTSGVFVETFKSSSGCDSIRTLNLNILQPSEFTLTTTICEGEAVWGYTKTGNYRDILVAANGCDSTRVLNLTVLSTQKNIINHTICEGEAFLGYTISGSYSDKFIGSNGCDSIRILNLTVNPKKSVIINHSICEGESYLGYNSSGTYTDKFLTNFGCDSIRTLNLIVNSKLTTTVNKSICQGQSYEGHNTSGVFVETFKSSSGCDSIRTLNLIVLEVSEFTFTTTICEGEAVWGYTHTGNYRDVFVSANGCDSIRILQLNVKPKKYSTIDTAICWNEFYDGYNLPGTYIDTFISSVGCDSIRTLILKINDIPKPILQSYLELCIGDSIVLSPGLFNSYLWQDNSVNSNYIVKRGGLYTVKVTNDCSEAEVSVTITERLCNEYYPNAFTPNDDGKNDYFKILNANGLTNYNLKIYNRWGQIVFETNDYRVGWDGKFKGKQQQSGIFVYIYNYSKDVVRKSGSGTLSLIL